MSNNTILKRNLRCGVVFDYELCGIVAARYFSLVQSAGEAGVVSRAEGAPSPFVKPQRTLVTRGVRSPPFSHFVGSFVAN